MEGDDAHALPQPDVIVVMGIGKLKIPEGVSAKHVPLLTTLANDYKAAYETAISKDERSEEAMVTARDYTTATLEARSDALSEDEYNAVKLFVREIEKIVVNSQSPNIILTKIEKLLWHILKALSAFETTDNGYTIPC